MNYDDYYESAKLTLEELRTFKELKGMTDKELEKFRDDLFKLALFADRIVRESKGKS
jgi:ribosomal protein L29